MNPYISAPKNLLYFSLFLRLSFKIKIRLSTTNRRCPGGRLSLFYTPCGYLHCSKLRSASRVAVLIVAWFPDT